MKRECGQHQFFCVDWRWNSGNPYTFLCCLECFKPYGWWEPRDWPEVPVIPHTYVVGVPRV